MTEPSREVGIWRALAALHDLEARTRLDLLDRFRRRHLVLDGKLVAACTSRDGLAAARRLMGTDQ